MRYVYGDILFAVNLLLDFALLWFIRRYGGFRARTWRLWLAAGAGAGYALLAVFPGWWGAAPVRLLVPVPLVLIAFAPQSLPGIVRAVALMYAGAFLYAGAALALAYCRQLLAAGPALAAPVIWWVPLLGALVGAVLFWYFWQHRNAAPAGPVCAVEISLGEATVTLRGLVDTGNQLRDPLGDLPVAVVECNAVAALLPPGLVAVYAAGHDEDFGRIGETLSGTALAPRARLVPFTSIGRQSGMLLGFRPDVIRIRAPKATCSHTGAVVCLYRGTLSHDRSYQALLHPDLARPLSEVSG
ncbi:MAG: sigma-E processing peptidase SpoIIGA [Chloroflexota bacterium]